MAQTTVPAGHPARRWLVALLAIAVAAIVVLVTAALVMQGQPGVAVASSTPAPSLTVASIAPSPSAAAATQVPVPTPPPPTPAPVAAAPLTGLPVSPAAALQHPIAVMVDDHPDARPQQAGFNAASIVWHAPAEGGVPRYMLIFQDGLPSSVGPVRSARQYYIEWAAEWNAMYVHSGGSPQAIRTLIAKGQGQWVYNADEYRWGGRYLWRAVGHVAPHNVYSDGAHLRELAVRVGALDEPIEPVWSFGPDAARNLRPDGGSLRVVYLYGTVTYRYDSVTNRYVRYLDRSTAPQVDVADGQIVAPTNVVILRMAFEPLNDGNPAKHRLEAHNVGTGEAWIATNGRTVKGRWSKASITAPTLLLGADGKPIRLTAGQTFVQVLPLANRYQIVAGTLLPHQVPRE